MNIIRIFFNQSRFLKYFFQERYSVVQNIEHLLRLFSCVVHRNQSRTEARTNNVAFVECRKKINIDQHTNGYSQKNYEIKYGSLQSYFKNRQFDLRWLIPNSFNWSGKYSNKQGQYGNHRGNVHCFYFPKNKNYNIKKQ